MLSIFIHIVMKYLSVRSRPLHGDPKGMKPLGIYFLR
jgi:hypothetical protein